jgi:hypothetical protein
MTTSDREQLERQGARLQALMRLGPGANPTKVVLDNPQWTEASRLGQILLDHWAAAAEARRAPTEAEPEGTD